MISYEQACAIAKKIRQKRFQDLNRVYVTDITDRWSFVFTPDDDTYMTPSPCFFVFKDDGRVEWFSIPPLENLDLLESGTKIPFIW